MGHSLFNHSLSQSELSALRLDGELSPRYEFWEHIDDWRSRSFQVLSKEIHPLVLTSESAAWALGAIPAPQVHTASTITVHRIRQPRNPEVKIEQRNLITTEFWSEGMFGVTTPMRTVTDLLRSGILTSAQSVDISRKVQQHFSLEKENIIAGLKEMVSYPNVRNAILRALTL
jgi:hypothetical protein